MANSFGEDSIHSSGFRENPMLGFKETSEAPSSTPSLRMSKVAVIGEIEAITLGWLNRKFMINRYSHRRTLPFYKIDFLGSTD
jgi:hypothetical protein